MTWNISNVGAIAAVESTSYGVSLAAVGLLTTALFVTHLAVQIPGGRLIDRVGARNIGLSALAIVAAGNAIALASPTLGVGLGARALMGLGTGVGFVAGIDLVRAGLGGPFWQGAYGGSTMAAGGLALMVVPQLAGELGWRAPFWTGLVLALAGVVGGLILFAGIVTRPAGGLLMRRAPDRAWAFVATALVAGSTGVLVLAAAPPLWLAAIAALIVGLAAGLPFAPIFNTTLRLRPDAPAAAIGFVNGSAVVVILVGTPLTGLTFRLPGDGRVGFLLIGLLWATALLAVSKASRS